MNETRFSIYFNMVLNRSKNWMFRSNRTQFQSLHHNNHTIFLSVLNTLARNNNTHCQQNHQSPMQVEFHLIEKGPHVHLHAEG